MDFWRLFFAALMPVLKVLLITCLGTFLALDRFHIFKGTAKKNLNTIVFFVFSPALVSSSLAETITSRSIITLWFMPLNVLLTFIIGAALGWLLVKLIKVPHHLQGLALGCCAAGNLGNLTLIIVPSLCDQRGSPFGDLTICQKKGLAYASLSMAIGAIYIWSIAYNIVRIYSKKISSEVKVEDSTINSPVSALETNQEIISHTDNVKQFEIECTIPNEQIKVPKKKNSMNHLYVLAQKINLRVLFAPSSIGAIVGLVIGVVPPFRKLLIVDNAPLGVLKDSVVLVGGASIPSMTILVGANLLKGLKSFQKQFLPLIVGIVVVRFLLLPAIGIGIVKGAIHIGLIHPDPLYQFLLLLQFALPPAIAMSTITQLFGASQGECALIMFATYSCAAVSLTLWSTFFMWLVL